MRRLRWLTVLVALTLAASAWGVTAVRAGTFRQWTPMNDGLWGSDVTCLWRSPSGTLFAGTAQEGVFATSDNGLHWQWSGQGLANSGTTAEPRYRSVLSIAGAPGAGAMVYLATGLGAYRSADGGSTWTPMGSGVMGMRVSCVAADPASPSVLLVGTDDGVYASQDGGATWAARNEQMRKVRVTRVVFDVRANGQAYACTPTGLYKSTDHGQTWVGLSSAVQGAVIQCLAQDSRRPDILFAGTTVGVYRSYDAGTSWALLSPRNPAGSVLEIGIDTFDVALVAALTSRGVLVSTDGGETWTEAYHASSSVSCCAWGRLAAQPDVVLGTPTGVVWVTGGSGARRVEGLGFLDVTAVGYDAHTDAMYAVRGSSLFRSDGGGVWQAIEGNLGNARVYSIAVDRNEPRLMYAGTEYGVLRSTDGGLSWIQLAITPSNPRGKIQAVAVDPADGRYVYAGNDYGLYRSDKGFRESWLSVGPPSIGGVVAVAVAPGSGSTVYALSATTLWKSTDRCVTWAAVNGSLSALGLTSLAVADDGTTLYAGSGSGAMTSLDGGATWRAAGASLQGTLVNSVCLGSQGKLLAGTNGGFYAGTLGTDNSGPVFQGVSPADGTTVSASQVTISGSVSDAVSGVTALTVGGRAAIPGANGAFAVTLVLAQGPNRIVLRAEDAAGNVTEVPLTITYRVPAIVLQLTVGSPVMTIVPGRTVALDAPPVILSGRTLVAIRPIVEALGGTIAWSASDRKVTILQGGHTIQLWIDRNTATVDGASVPIDATSSAVAPKIISGRTMVPLRFVAEALGAEVEWEAAAKRITITYEGGS